MVARHRVVVGCAVAALVASTLGAPVPVAAFKPSTHEQSAFEALEDAVVDGSVTIEGRDVAVDPEILDALRRFPEAYRAGVLGPDAYPDLYVGQAMIHPDTRTDNDRLPPNSGRTSYTDDWLNAVWEAAHALPPGDERAEAMAFTVGYLTHAAGDVWGHTLVNDFAGGVFPSITEPSEAMIAVRHVIVEGYIDHRRPVPASDPADLSAIAVPSKFVVDTFITSDFARTHSEPLHFDQFLNRRAMLNAQLGLDLTDLRVQDPNIFDAPNNPLERWFLQARVALNRQGIADIDDGLAKWPEFSTRIARAVLAPDSSFSQAKEEAIVFGFRTVFPMLGIPRAFGDGLLWLRAIVADFNAQARQLFKPLVDAVAAVEEIGVNFLLERFIDVSQLPPDVAAVVDMDGNGSLSLDELRNLSAVDVLVRNPAIVAPERLAQLDALMGVETVEDTFDTESFAAYHDAAVMSRLILLNRDGLNDLATQLGVVGDLYPADDPTSDNVMLGWIRSIDGDYQWRSSTLRTDDDRSFGFGTMRLWEDCRARDAVFRTIFDEPLPGAFADTGDPCT